MARPVSQANCMTLPMVRGCRVRTLHLCPRDRRMLASRRRKTGAPRRAVSFSEAVPCTPRPSLLSLDQHAHIAHSCLGVCVCWCAWLRLHRHWRLRQGPELLAEVGWHVGLQAVKWPSRHVGRLEGKGSGLARYLSLTNKAGRQARTVGGQLLLVCTNENDGFEAIF